MTFRIGVLLGSFLILPTSLLAAAAPAIAVPTTETEPNDNIFQMNGPISVDGAVGTLGTSGDVDRFLVGLRPQRQVRVRVEVTNPSACPAYYDGSYELETESGQGLVSGSFQASSPTDDFLITTPGAFGGPTVMTRFNVFADSDAVGCGYRLSVASSTGGATDAIDPSPVASYPLGSLPEPNDLDSQATGPLAGEVSYQAAIETDNDVDQIYFQLKAGAAVNVKLSVAAGDVDADSVTAGLSDLSASAGSEDTESTDAVGYDRTFRLKMTGDAGSSYRILITPASSLGTTVLPPPPPSTQEPVRVTLSARKNVVRKGGIVSLKGRVVGRSRGKVVIYQKNLRRGSRWVVEARKSINSRGVFRHREDVNSGSRRYKACYRRTCSRPITVRMR